uniref:Uncharacterized protein n=1 Tax=Nelumbo nucifera TaxID=4432 RepID=A0A822Y910_NELNU|nr:TPA_asm: hypothetical protein HUJ06_030220 [Nelumbo nucifera]
MAHKHLRELLREDQEPFALQSYIDERRCQLKKWTPRTQLQVKRRRPISENSSFPGSLCKSACFFSFHDSPDVRRSPVFDFASPAKSPCRNSNTLFIHIPSRTAAVLLEAALRIQKQSSSSKFKSPNKSLGFGFFGSILKRISLRKRNRKREIKGEEVRVSVKDILRWDSSDGRKICQDDDRLENREPMEVLDYNRVSEMGFSCSCNTRLSSAWSESNEEKSEDLETSTSSRSEASEAMEFIVDERKNGECNSCEKAFCSSSFRFMLPKSPSSSRRTPEFQSPATSPSRHRKEVSRCEEGSLNCVGKDYEEEKEQCSPVSVLDPLFGEDDDNDDDDDGKNQDEEMGEGFELEHSFAIVQSKY